VGTDSELDGLDHAPALEQLERATDHLLDTAAGLTDDEVAGPSLLPGWTRAQVLTHVARNADSYTRALSGVRTGTDIPRYPSWEARNADVEAGAGRSAADLLTDLRTSAVRLAEECAALPAEGWAASVRSLPGGSPYPVASVPRRRLKEVLIHHVDLDAGYTPAHLPADFVRQCLDEVVGMFDGRDDVPPLALYAEDTDRRFVVHGGGPTISGPERALLAWLVGRSTGDGLDIDPDGPLPALPPWA
jgi:maleylpyruvate isomerase